MAPVISLSNLPCFSVGILKDIFAMIVSLCKSSKSSKEGSNEPRFEHRLSPLLVPVPLHLIAESNKERPAMSRYCQIRTNSSESGDENCTVCLSTMKDCDEVRKLPNCGHVFHKDCIDVWIDKCVSTCPICRSGLHMVRGEKLKYGEDPWRRERMIYLFGEDFIM